MHFLMIKRVNNLILLYFFGNHKYFTNKRRTSNCAFTFLEVVDNLLLAKDLFDAKQGDIDFSFGEKVGFVNGI